VKKTSTKKVSSVNKQSVTKNSELFIAGIGASAGGLEALRKFFDNSSFTGSIAYIIVQHLDPTHKSMLAELLSTHTKMKVSEAKDGTKVQADCVYIIPPNKDLRIFQGVLQLLKPNEMRSSRRTIDSFFHSLAIDQKEKAIGIVLSGTGTEGTLGLKEIRNEGGFTLVQQPESAEFKGMPQNAISANVADHILTPENMPEKLIQHVQSFRKKHNLTNTQQSNSTENQLKKIFQIIRHRTGYDFSNYKTNTILRRIQKRSSFMQLHSLNDYIDYLQNNPNEIEKLYKEFFIGVTSFFRDEAVFSVIEKKVIPYLLETCRDKQELRVWVCACSTGEEAYSLAILFKEALEKSKLYLKVTIFATDIDKESIDSARAGIYNKSSISQLSSSRLERFFNKLDNGYQLKKEIREMLVFAQHNIVKDPPFSKMDMISCRNLLIYMNSELQKKILPIFHYGLNKEGILLLGTSESIGDFTDLFSVYEAKNKIYKKKKESHTSRLWRDYEVPEQKDNATESIVKPINMIRKKINVSSLTEKLLLDAYAPPCVIIDKNNDAIYFSGSTGKYIEPPKGEASLNILEMAKKGLKSDLDNAIKKSRLIKSEVRVNDLSVKVNSHFQNFDLVVKPALSKGSELEALMIIFESTQKAKKIISEKYPKPNKAKEQNRISELEKELKITSEHLQLAVNELETSNEDLQTANEEYQSSNEELQSTNEELETSREELQSVNEELITVNTELSSKIDQLSQSNDDLNNLLSSIEVATIFLDRELKVKRYTPAATKIFNLIPSDVDRPVTHLSGNIIYKSLTEDVKEVLRTLAVRSVEIQSNDRIWYHMRILPYRTTENIIEGVLVTFVDITEQKQTEERLKKANEHLNLVLENLPAVPFTVIAGEEIKISFVGKSSEKVTGFAPEKFTSSSSFWFNRIHPDDKKKMRSAFTGVVKKGKLDLNFRWKCAASNYKHFINYMRYVPAEKGRQAYIVGVWQEIQK